MRGIRVTPGFVAALCLLGWCDLRLCGFFLLGLTVHEAAHLTALALFHRPVRGLTLRAGGAKIETEALTLRQEALSAAAGPLVNLLSGALTLRCVPAFSAVSLGLAAVNLRLADLFDVDGRSLLADGLASGGAVAHFRGAGAAVPGRECGVGDNLKLLFRERTGKINPNATKEWNL